MSGTIHQHWFVIVSRLYPPWPKCQFCTGTKRSRFVSVSHHRWFNRRKILINKIFILQKLSKITVSFTLYAGSSYSLLSGFIQFTWVIHRGHVEGTMRSERIREENMQQRLRDEPKPFTSQLHNLPFNPLSHKVLVFISMLTIIK